MRQPQQPAGERIDIERVDGDGGIRGDLSERRGGRREHRRATGQGLDHRQPEALVDRGEREHLAQAVERRQLRERHVAGEVHDVGEAELDKGGDGGVKWCEDMMRRSDRELGTHVPVATIKAHVFAIQKRREKAAIGGTTDG